jgi:hypothetical protein
VTDAAGEARPGRPSRRGFGLAALVAAAAGVLGSASLFAERGFKAPRHAQAAADEAPVLATEDAAFAVTPFSLASGGSVVKVALSTANAPLAGSNTGAGAGVAGTATTGAGVYGQATGTGYGVYGTATSGSAVAGVSTSGAGVSGSSTSSAGVSGSSSTSYGVSGTGNTAAGVYGTSSTGAGVQGYNHSTGAGVAASAYKGAGVSATSYYGNAVTGASTYGRGGVFTGTNVAQVQLVPGGASHPKSGSAGDLYVDHSARLWFCKGGTTWKQIA